MGQPPRRLPPPGPGGDPLGGLRGGHQEAHIRREKKGRGGKTVTVVYNLRLPPEDLKVLGRHLRQVCGTGGTVKDGVIEIQGDHGDKVAEALQLAGYRTKFTGG